MKNISIMQKNVGKAFRWVLVLSLLLVLFTISGYAVEERAVIDSGTCGTSVTWTLYDDGELHISGTGAMADYSSSGESFAPWRRKYLYITSAVVEAGVTNIGNYAFNGCYELTSITLPKGVKTIGSSAFGGCLKLTDITLPENVTTIGTYAFDGCTSLASITVPESVTSIGQGAFSGTKLTSIIIPENVISIGNRAFSGSSLKSIEVLPDNANYSSLNGVLFSKSQDVLIACPGGIEGDYSIPDGVCSISDYAFYNCKSLESVTIANGVTAIGKCAFQNCSSLNKIVIPDSVKLITADRTSVGIFYGCSKLNSAGPVGSGSNIEFGWIAEIPSYAFKDASALTSIVIPDGITTLNLQPFWGCSSLNTITIPNSITAISSSTFSGCTQLKKVLFRGTKSQLNQIKGGDYMGYVSDSIKAEVIFLLYDVIYDANGGSGTMEPAAVGENEIIELLNCQFVPPAYQSFKAWNVAGKDYLPGDRILVEGDTLVAAVWEDCQHDLLITGEEISLKPTCGTSGSKEVEKTCNRCGYTVTYTEEIPATGLHDFAAESERVIYQENCGKAGIKEITSRCAVCGATIISQEEIAPTGMHNYGELIEVQAPIASLPGQGEQICSICGQKRIQHLFGVRYRPNGGKGVMENSVVVEGETLILPECGYAPVNGKVFKAWGINGAEVAPGTEYQITGNTVFTALWKKQEQTVTWPTLTIPFSYDPPSTAITAEYGQKINFKEPDSNTGYIVTYYAIMDEATKNILTTKTYSIWGPNSKLGDDAPTQSGRYIIQYKLSEYEQTLVQVNGSYQYMKKPTGVPITYNRILVVRPGTTLPSEEDAVPFSASKRGEVIEYKVAPDTFSGKGIIVAASYSENQKLIDSKYISINDLSAGSTGTLSLKMDRNEAFQLYLLDTDSFEPLAESQGESNRLKKEVFELLRDYAKSNGTTTDTSSGIAYKASVPVQDYSGEILYFPTDDTLGFYCSGKDTTQSKLLISALEIQNTGKIGECVFSQTEISSQISTQAFFGLDLPNFDGRTAPTLSEYISAEPTSSLEKERFLENGRHSFTQLLVMLNIFLSERDHSITELGFTSFVPENYPSQNVVFNELVHYAIAGEKMSNGNYRNVKDLEMGTTYHVTYCQSDHSITLGTSMSGVTCDTRIKIYADMRQPYDVEMEFFQYSGTGKATIDPGTYTNSTPIEFIGSNAGNSAWESECKTWVDMILGNTTVYPLGIDSVMLKTPLFYDLKDLGFALFEVTD